MKKFLCLAAMAALLVSCGGKKQPHAEVTSGSVFAPEVLADTVQAEALTGQAFTIDVPSDWRSGTSGIMGNSCVLHLRKAPYTEVNITTAPKLKPEAYVAQREKEGCKHRPDVEVYGRVFSVYDRTDSDANIILYVGTPFEDGMFIMTLKAGPQRLPMEETHAAMYDNMKTLLERIVFR
jgi:hypothetical protein